MILAIETSNPSAWTPASPACPGVALGRDGEVIGVEPIYLEPGEDDLMAAVARLCDRAGVRPRDLTAVAVSVGPGGYTALRIAVATAKMLAEATGASCVAVPSAEVAARRAPRGRPFSVALASKGESAHITDFAADGTLLRAGGLAGTGSLGTRGSGLLIADRFLPPAITAEAKSLGIPVLDPVFDPAACLEAAAGRAPVDPVALAPLYPREPEAVTKWRALHP